MYNGSQNWSIFRKNSQPIILQILRWTFISMYMYIMNREIFSNTTCIFTTGMRLVRFWINIILKSPGLSNNAGTFSQFQHVQPGPHSWPLFWLLHCVLRHLFLLHLSTTSCQMIHIFRTLTLLSEESQTILISLASFSDCAHSHNISHQGSQTQAEGHYPMHG